MRLLDHLVGAREQRRRHFEAERLRCFHLVGCSTGSPRRTIWVHISSSVYDSSGKAPTSLTASSAVSRRSRSKTKRGERGRAEPRVPTKLLAFVDEAWN
jgi:hypothetical protein